MSNTSVWCLTAFVAAMTVSMWLIEARTSETIESTNQVISAFTTALRRCEP